MASASEIAHKNPSGLLVMMLALLSMVTPLATDMYLPGFPQLALEFGATASGVQLTLTAFLIGLGIGQLVIGALSDAHGRRRPMIIGTFICMVATVACAMAPTLETLIAARFIQGMSGAAAIVLARAMITDIAQGNAAARLMSLMMLIGGIAPVVAPVAGGVLVVSTGWRGVFWALAVVNALMLLGVLLYMKETLPVERRRAGGVMALLRSGRLVLGNRNYLGYTLTFAFAFGALFAYISASPFVLQNVLGLSEMAYSLTFGANALGMVVAGGMNMKLVGRFSSRGLLTGAIVALFVASAVLFVVVLFAEVNLVATLICLFVAVSTFGFIFGQATALALAQVRQYAGTGSAFMGAIQFTVGAAVTPIVGIAGEEAAGPMAIAMFVLAALSLASLYLITHKPAKVG